MAIAFPDITSFDDAVAQFIAAVHDEEEDRMLAIVSEHPAIARHSLHVAAALGDAATVSRLVHEEPSRVHAKLGKPESDAVLLLCFSPLHGESPTRDEGFERALRTLLAAGGNPNSRNSELGIPALYAVTGRRSVLPLARMLLEAGARPNDGESLFHAAEHFHEDALELLCAHGADVNFVGDWGNTPLHFLMRWIPIMERPEAQSGVEWLFAHGADPNVRCGPERETALHAAVRNDQLLPVVSSLIARGADVHARRADGRSAWQLAYRAGRLDVLKELVAKGAKEEETTPMDQLLHACAVGDFDRARALSSAALLESVEPEDLEYLTAAVTSNRDEVVLAFLAAGFSATHAVPGGATLLHYAAIAGNAALVETLIAHGASLDVKDDEHWSSPLGWACFGGDHVRRHDGDYPGAVRALLTAGARMRQDEYYPAREDLVAVLREFGDPGRPMTRT